MAYGIENHLGKNIRALRDFSGLSGEEISVEMGYSSRWIFNHESGTNLPDAKQLNEIASFFGVSSDMLLNYDYSELEIMEAQKCLKAFVSNLENVIPFFKIDFDNSCFNKGYKYLLDIKHTDFPTKNDYIQCKKMFISAWKETKRKEAVANYIAMIFYRFFEKESFSNQMDLSEIEYKKIIMSQYHIKQERVTNRKEILAEYGSDMEQCIKILKADSKWSQLGDYYLALKYLFGISSHELPIETSSQIGSNLMIDLCNCDNKYATSFLKFLDDIEIT